MKADTWIAISGVCTGLLAVATFWLAYLTRKLEQAWMKTSLDQIGVQVWLQLEGRFDSKEMKRARKKLAEQVNSYSISKHSGISEMVPEFFESVGTAYSDGFIHKRLADSSFGFYVCRWWEALKAYVDHERRLHGEDKSLFTEFERLAAALRMSEETIDHDEVQRFLADEMKLE
jgi:hypothetical protein